ncbi:ribose-phosphate diphosphokinase [Pseudonocardia endophytica]|uniref:ribose-phosphate diphosphokinase n=1 Tax=Pseudonocardia endophytica TaxID=401976 RepID=A0A4R1HEA3_PSEEN|nr:ribose-phosphate diphosphokinase [Pseudonocardia endophytica]TCK19918.1 ribose-phosphate pyrophosphokinase [Pseudonocardia endophytica]
MTDETRRRTMLVGGRGYPELTEQVAKHLDVPVTPQSVYDFANGETFVRFEESVRGADVFVVQSVGSRPDKALLETLIMVDSLKRASAGRITVILPFYPYARQDKKHRGREPVTARLVSDLLHTAGAHRLITVDLHADQIQGFFDGPVDHLQAQPLLAAHVQATYGPDDLTVVSPDAGRARLAEKWAGGLGSAPMAFIHKTRDVAVPNHAVANRVVGDVAGRLCVLVDDMIDTAGTVAAAVERLFAAGARDVVVAATHGVLSDPASTRLAGSGVREVIVTNTLEVPDERRFPGLTVLSIAPLIASAIEQIVEDGSVTSLFEG